MSVLYVILAIICSAFLGIIITRVIIKRYSRSIVMPNNTSMSRKDFPVLLKKLNQIYNVPYVHISVDLSKVEVITHSAYIVIMAQIEKAVFNKGKRPNFYINTYNSSLIDVVLNGNNSKVHHKHFLFDTLKDDFQNKSKELTPNIIYTLENDLRRIRIHDYFELNTIVTELLSNAIEHGIKNKDINWWFHHRYDTGSKSVKISFVDMGTGIVSSYRKAGLPPGYKDRGDLQIVKDALNGTLGSSTKNENRGRGLPQIMNMVKKKWISDFILITNKVSVRYINNEIQYQEHGNFVGTFYFFSVNKNNYDIWKKELTSRMISA